MKRFLAIALAVTVVTATVAGTVLADWSKSTLLGTLKTAQEKVKDKGASTLERINATGLKEDGTIDLSQPGSTLQYSFQAGGKSWSVSYVPIGQPEPYVSVAESPVPGEALPADVASKMKDGADLAKAAKAAGVTFPANISVYAPEKGKAWAVITSNDGSTSAILDPVTGEKIH